MRAFVFTLLFAASTVCADTSAPADAPALVSASLAAMQAGRVSEAEAGLTRLVALTAPGARAADVAAHRVALATLGCLLQAAGRGQEAEHYLRQAVAESTAKTAEHSTFTVGLAGILMDRGRTGEAERLAGRALKAWERLVGRSSVDLIPGLNVLAEGRIVRGELADAERLLRRADRIAAMSGAEPVLRAAVACRRGLLWMQMGRYHEAEPVLERSVELAEESVGPDHPALLQIYSALARCYRLRNRPRDAALLYGRCLAIAEKAYGPDHPIVRAAREGLVQAGSNVANVLSTQRR
jgi:tetratricopeptide (TPR) repeat protein